MLWWMVELVIVRVFLPSLHSSPRIPAPAKTFLPPILSISQCVSNLSVSDDLDDPSAPGAPDPFEKTFFDHAAKAYTLFLSGSDDFEKLDAELAARFGVFLHYSFFLSVPPVPFAF
jgi:SMC interacting uncharacterized protein involved in chromosome segregation